MAIIKSNITLDNSQLGPGTVLPKSGASGVFRRCCRRGGPVWPSKACTPTVIIAHIYGVFGHFWTFSGVFGRFRTFSNVFQTFRDVSHHPNSQKACGRKHFRKQNSKTREPSSPNLRYHHGGPPLSWGAIPIHSKGITRFRSSSCIQGCLKQTSNANVVKC